MLSNTIIAYDSMVWVKDGRRRRRRRRRVILRSRAARMRPVAKNKHNADQDDKIYNFQV